MLLYVLQIMSGKVASHPATTLTKREWPSWSGIHQLSFHPLAREDECWWDIVPCGTHAAHYSYVPASFCSCNGSNLVFPFTRKYLGGLVNCCHASFITVENAAGWYVVVSDNCSIQAEEIVNCGLIKTHCPCKWGRFWLPQRYLLLLLQKPIQPFLPCHLLFYIKSVWYIGVIYTVFMCKLVCQPSDILERKPKETGISCM